MCAERRFGLKQGGRGQGGKLSRRATRSQACVEAFERTGSSSIRIVPQMHVQTSGLEVLAMGKWGFYVMASLF